MEQNSKPTRPHTQIVKAPPKVLAASLVNFLRVADLAEQQYYHERPMTLNAWSQTTSEDFDYLLDDNLQQKEPTKTEKELLEKIRVLEENLRAHAEILSQLNGANISLQSNITSDKGTDIGQQANCTSLSVKEDNKLYIQQQPATVQVLSQNEGTYLPQQSILQQGGEPQRYQLEQKINIAPQCTSIINPVQHIQMPTESIKYTIIAEGNEEENGEPIEIHVANGDGVNLNSSTDSGRLEICLSDDNDIKGPPTGVNVTPVPTQSTPTPSCPPHTPNNSYSNASGKSLLKRLRYETSLPPTSPENDDHKMDLGNVMMSIGPNNTRIPAKLYETMSWASASIATRKLLMSIFDRQTLATHSMTGKPSPAFKDHGKPLKQMLNPLIIQDIIFAVTRRCHVSEKEVRNAITTKCADENKMMKLQMNKTRSLRELNKENMG